jgi:tripeptidyl-peptidase I
MWALTRPLFSLGLLSLAVAEPLLSPLVLHEKRNHLPVGWSLSHRHHPAAVLTLRFGLSQPNLHAIDQFINDVAHPDSPNYGNHWTAAQVVEKFAPSRDTIQTVRTWLLDSGFAGERIRVTSTKLWVELNVTVDEAEKLLNTEYHVYKHASGKKHVCEYTDVLQ